MGRRRCILLGALLTSACVSQPVPSRNAGAHASDTLDAGTLAGTRESKPGALPSAIGATPRVKWPAGPPGDASRQTSLLNLPEGVQWTFRLRHALVSRGECVSIRYVLRNATSTWVSIDLPGVGPVFESDVAVRDTSGREIWRRILPQESNLVGSKHRIAPRDSLVWVVHWNQHDSAGHQVSPGLYLVRAYLGVGPLRDSGATRDPRRLVIR